MSVYEKLNDAIDMYGLNHPITISISQMVDKVVVDKQLKIKEIYEQKLKYNISK